MLISFNFEIRSQNVITDIIFSFSSSACFHCTHHNIILKLAETLLHQEFLLSVIYSSLSKSRSILNCSSCVLVSLYSLSICEKSYVKVLSNDNDHNNRNDVNCLFLK